MTLFPLYYFFFCRQRALLSLAGLFLAAVICGFRVFFMFRSPYDGDSVLFYMLHSWFSFAALPLFLVFCLLMLLVRASREERARVFLPFELAFYAAYLPVSVFGQSPTPSFFLLFVKPVLYLCLVRLSASLWNGALASFGRRSIGSCCLFLVCLLLASWIPAFAEALWYYGFLPLLWGGLSFFFVAGALCFVLKERLTGFLPVSRL